MNWELEKPDINEVPSNSQPQYLANRILVDHASVERDNF